MTKKRWAVKFITTIIILYCLWTTAKMILFHDCKETLINREIEKWGEIK